MLNFNKNPFCLQLVMQYLYSGGTHSLELSGNDADVLELMAAASFFQLEGLLRYTEARCAEIIDIDNVVAMYIHAKVSSDTFSVLLSRHSRSLDSSVLSTSALCLFNASINFKQSHFIYTLPTTNLDRYTMHLN